MPAILTENSILQTPAAMRLATSRSVRPAEELLAVCHFPPPGHALDLAVSGGPDSVALAALAAMAGVKGSIWHVDHGLRPTSAEEASAVEAFAGALGMPFHLVRDAVAGGPNLEARARELRRERIPPGAATGHTMDDQAETVLINLARGAGPRGLAGMRPGPSKPLLGIRRADTEAICAALGLNPIRDPSNQTPDFVRNRVRHELLPLIGEITRRDPVPILARSAGVFREEDDLLDFQASALDAEDAAALAGAARPLRMRALRQAVSSISGYPPDRASLERLEELIARGGRFRLQLSGGVEVQCARGKIAYRAITPTD